MTKMLVTGGNGFVAAQVLISALNRGYEVVATVRNQEKANQTKKALAPRLTNKLSNLSFAIVPDIEADDAFDQVIKDNLFSAVLHTATPFHLKAKDPKEITGPAVGSTKSILKSIKDFGPTIKRVVITSSFAAIIDMKKGIRPGYVYTEKDWNPISWEEMHDGNPENAYYGAKTWAEKAAWEFVEQEKPQFDLVTICPPMIFGDVAQYVESTDELNTSSETLYGILNGKGQELPPTTVTLWVNVVDVGTAHVLAIEAKNAGNRRFLICGDGTYSNKKIAEAFTNNFPDFASRIPTKLPKGADEGGYPIGGYYKANNSISKEILGIKYQGFDETMVQFVHSIADIPKA